MDQFWIVILGMIAVWLVIKAVKCIFKILGFLTLVLIVLWIIPPVREFLLNLIPA